MKYFIHAAVFDPCGQGL